LAPIAGCGASEGLFVKLPLGKLHIWKVATWEIVTWKGVLGKMPLGKHHNIYITKVPISN